MWGSEPTADDRAEGGIRRRTLLRTAGAGALAVGLAGCSDQTRRYEAEIATLAPEASERGYSRTDDSTAMVTRNVEAGGVNLEVTLVSHLESYERTGDEAFVQTPEVGLASTPAVEEAGVALNPIADDPLGDLLTRDIGRDFVRQLGVDGSWQRGPQQVGTGSGNLLDKPSGVDFQTYAGVTEDDEFALLNVVRTQNEGDAVLVGDARTKPVEDPDNPFVAPDGYVDRETVDKSAAMFADLLPLVVHPAEETPTGTATVTDTSAAETLPVLEVTSKGIPQSKATALAEELGVDGEFEVDEHGRLQYLDPEAYMPLPTAEAEPRQEAGGEEDGERDTSMALDVGALDELPEPPNADEMADRFLSALEATEPLPAAPVQVSTRTSHASVELVDADDGSTTLERDLDTAVYVDSSVNGVPLVGSGAHIRARFTSMDGDTVLSDVRHSFREVETGEEVPIASPRTANARYRKALSTVIDAESFELMQPELRYLAPGLERENDNPLGEGENRVQALIPHYEVGGTAFIEAGGQDGTQEVALLREFVPAVEDESYVPRVELEASGEGSQVNASVAIEGGQSPYRVDWGTTDGVVAADTTGDPRELSETLRSREPIDQTTVTVEVTDANGVTVRSQQEVAVDAASTTPRRLSAISRTAGTARTGGTRPGRFYASGGTFGTAGTGDMRPGRADVALESSAYPPFGEGLVQRATAAGIAEQYSWIDNMVWEKDWRDPTDNQYGVDTADLVYNVAHGNPRGFSPGNSNHDDGWVGTLAGDGAWGDYDLEWHSLMSCNVLAPNDSKCGGCNGESRVERWGQEFDGLHQLHGFQTVGQAWKKFPRAYVRYFTGRGWAIPPLPMRTAWFLATDNHQPGTDKNHRWQKRGVVMAPVDSQGRTPINDWFWGRGPVGPDIPNADIDHFCIIVAAEGGG